jgi:hypothetical protein
LARLTSSRERRRRPEKTFYSFDAARSSSTILSARIIHSF